MPTSIGSNPTTFGAGAAGPAGSVRFAFFNEGYTRTGSELPGDPVPNPPLNLFAFREGGGIVPASGTTFDTIGAGTLEDPLRLSQFSGFTVPSPTGTVYMEAVSLNASNQEYNDQPGSALAGVRMLDTGEFQGIINDSDQVGWYTLFNWRTGGATSFWSFRATQTLGGQSGSNIVNGTYTTGWVAASTLPQWDVAGYSNSFQRFGQATRTFTLELALTSNTSNVLASASISITATASTNAGEIP